MNRFRAAVRRTLGRARRLPTRLLSTVRGPVMLGLMATLLAPALVMPAPVRADVPPDPAARLQVVITGIHIYNDRDWGEGEMNFFAGVYEGEAPSRHDAPSLAVTDYDFSADDGDDIVLERVLPGDIGSMANGVSIEAGIPVYAGHRYVFSTSMLERDNVLRGANDVMGDLVIEVNEENGWGIASYPNVRSVKSGGKQGDYGLTFEIRRVPLPDLKPTGLRIADLPGSTKKQVCTTVQNGASVVAGSFEVALQVDGVVPQDGRASGSGLAPGETGERCVEVLLATGPHKLEAVVDGLRQVPELDEANNSYSQQFTGASATPTPGPANADLTVSAILVRGRVPDGKDDCKDGKNDVAVVVKNGGTASAGAFDVRVIVDPVQKEGAPQYALVESVSGLEAGKEREVRFEDVRLKKGAHVLAAFADLKETVAESNENNNYLEVSATCKDDD